MDDPTPIEIRVDEEPGQPARLTVAGTEVDVPVGADPAEIGFGVVAAEAQRRGETVHAVLLDARDTLEWRVLVRPDGAITDDLDAFETPPTRRRLPLRRGLLVALGAAVVLGGVAYAAAGQPPSGPGPSSAMPPTSVRAVETSASSSSSTAVTPTSEPSTGPPTMTAVLAPPASARPVHAAAAPTSAVRLRPRPVQTTLTPARPSPAAPAPPAAAPSVEAPPAATPTRDLADASGRCLTAGLVVANCDGSPTQSWTYSDGRLHHGDQCLSYGSGLVLGACDAAQANGWTAATRTTTNAGLCLEVVGTRATLTQCGTGTALILTTF